MKNQLTNSFYALLIFIAVPSFVVAQAVPKEATVKVSGEVLSPLALTLASFKEFNQVTVVRKDRDGKDHTFNGVLLAELLKNSEGTKHHKLENRLSINGD